MSTANMLDELRGAGLLFEAQMTDKSRDWLRRRGIDPEATAEEAEGDWAGDLVECVSAIDR
ncbi:MAG: hypothetical protein QOH90_2082 [Actinomycetota bacterium]|jgi:hypothetical protein|nr:hypothetical protein [Actinomycetota bacterium]